MAAMNTGLGGPAGYGENVFSSSTKAAGGNDDGAVQVDVTSVFSNGITFFGETYSDIYINSNGAIVFGAADTSYDQSGPDDFSVPALLPFYSDINIGDGGEIYWDIDPGNGKITVTWDGVAPFSGSGNNSFQVVLSDLGNGDMGVEYIYGDIQWGANGGDAAYAGFTDGGSTDYALEFSGNASSMQGYETNDFDNGDPAGTFSFNTSSGIPDLLTVSSGSGDSRMRPGMRLRLAQISLMVALAMTASTGMRAMTRSLAGLATTQSIADLGVWAGRFPGLRFLRVEMSPVILDRITFSTQAVSELLQQSGSVTPPALAMAMGLQISSM
jgi:hypothetical protein